MTNAASPEVSTEIACTSVVEEARNIASALSAPDVAFWEPVNRYTTSKRRFRSREVTIGYVAHWYDDDQNPTLGSVAWVDASESNPLVQYKGVKFGVLAVFSELVDVIEFRDAETVDERDKQAMAEGNRDIIDKFAGYLAANAGQPRLWLPTSDVERNAEISRSNTASASISINSARAEDEVFIRSRPLVEVSYLDVSSLKAEVSA